MSNIYGLFDHHGNLRYIGKANNPADRLKRHMSDTVSGRRDYPVNRWIKKNGKPKLRILSADCDDWRAEERRLIAEARARGDNLLNVADGGDQPYCTIEQRRESGVRLQAHPNTAAQRKKNGVRLNLLLSTDPHKKEWRDLLAVMGQHIRAMKNAGHTFDPERLQRIKRKVKAANVRHPGRFNTMETMLDGL